MIKLHILIFKLPPDQQIAIIITLFRNIARNIGNHFFQHTTHQLSDIKHGVQTQDIGFLLQFELIFDMPNHGLCGCQISGCLYDDHTFTRNTKGIQLSKYRNVIYSGIGPGITDKKHTLL